MSARLCIVLLVTLAGCANDPQYLYPSAALEVTTDNPMTTASITLPIALESEIDAEERAALAAELAVEVPVVRLGELQISLEWTIRNLDDVEGTARIGVNGANEYFVYVPQNFVVDPEDDEEPPPLLGDIPLPIPPLATVSGVFREDQLREAAIDLELITRGASNPFAAVLQVHEDLQQIDAMGAVLPRRAFAQLIRLDLLFSADTHMVLELAVRLRDHDDLLHDELLAAPAAELIQFAPAVFVPELAP